jgi:hypothetical protein
MGWAFAPQAPHSEVYILLGPESKSIDFYFQMHTSHARMPMWPCVCGAFIPYLLNY